MHPSKGVTQEAFVRAWQTSTTTKEVVLKTGLTVGSAAVRASKLRKHGVPLKELSQSRPRVDYEALKELALSLAPPEIET